MRHVLRFVLGFIPATILLLISPLFLKSAEGEFSITPQKLRRIAMWLVGMDKMF
jgi:hypothetical protein